MSFWSTRHGVGHFRYPWRIAAGVLASSLVLAACVTTTNQPFRGRWWSFYDRGRVFLQEGDWQRAEGDFRTAMAMRDRDQHWARTYGLHLHPEYFPHRELGIALYRQGHYEEALTELERSLEMTFSGAGAYYLDEVRRAFIATNESDHAAPKIDVQGPAEGEMLGTLEIEVRATISDDTFVSAVLINGQAVSPRVAASRHEVAYTASLLPGNNTLLIEATDIVGKTSQRVIRLSADHDGPLLSLDRPRELPGEVTGMLWDASEVSTVTVGGQRAIVTQGPDGLHSFRAQVPAGSPTPLLCTAEDVHGNTTSQLLESDGDRLPPPQARVRVALGMAGPESAAILPGLLAQANPFETGSPAADPAPSSALQFNLPPDLRVYTDNVRVQLTVNADPSRNALFLMTETEGPSDQNKVRLLPGRDTQQVSRHFSLKNGPNTIVAQLTGPDGTSERVVTTVTRITPPFELPDQRLNAALLLPVWQDNSAVDSALCEEVYHIIEREMASRFTILDRSEAFQNLLLEHQISSANLSTSESRLNLSQLLGAEIFIEGKIAMIDREVIGLSAAIINGETSAKRALVDVAGPADSIEALATELAALVKQAYPNVPGYVSKVLNEKEVLSSLGATDGIVPDMRCVFYTYGEEILEENPATREIESRGRPIVILGNARISALQEKLSTVQRLPVDGEALPPWPELAEGDYLWVVTK